MDLFTIPTPSYVIDRAKLEENCRILAGVMERTGCKILLAQKAFSAFSQYPLIGKYLSGTTASGLFEARLGREEMGKENHVFSPAYRDGEFDEIVSLCDHIVFNSVSQLRKFKPRCKDRSVGLRINPQCSTQEHAIYDPCAPGSRLGATRDQIDESDFALVDGLHFHTLCEQNADALSKTLEAVEAQFGDVLPEMKWLNFGGGHHITRPDYDLDLLESCIRHVQRRYGAEVYLEPGEAVALNAGYLVTEVLERVENGGVTTLILDASAACHMPDVLEMPYRPPLCYVPHSVGARIARPLEAGSDRDPLHRTLPTGLPGEKAYTYRLGSYTCLAGDIIGDYSFDTPVEIGDKLVFEDMAIYSMVKNNTFNGIPLPSIYEMAGDGSCRLIKAFGYSDFKERLS